MNTIQQINEPDILTANTYLWHPSSNAAGRRSNERRNHSIVENFLSSLGFETTTSDDYVNGSLQHPELGLIKVSFYYRETCSNVYKSLAITREGKNSNIKLLRKLYA